MSDLMNVDLGNVHSDISFSLAQLQRHLIQKQFFVLEEQQRNLEKESKKLDMEIELLKKRGGV